MERTPDEEAEVQAMQDELLSPPPSASRAYWRPVAEGAAAAGVGGDSMDDNSLTLTAAELRAICERVDMEIMSSKPSTQAEIDRRRLFAHVDRLIKKCVTGWPDGKWTLPAEISESEFDARDAAVDALL